MQCVGGEVKTAAVLCAPVVSAMQSPSNAAPFSEDQDIVVCLCGCHCMDVCRCPNQLCCFVQLPDFCVTLQALMHVKL
jgi:hypothetical protein